MTLRSKLFGISEQERKEIVESFKQALRETVVELRPDKRYLLLLPEEGDTELAEEMANLIDKTLDMKNAPNIKLVLVQHPNIKLIEF